MEVHLKPPTNHPIPSNTRAPLISQDLTDLTLNGFLWTVGLKCKKLHFLTRDKVIELVDYGSKIKKLE